MKQGVRVLKSTIAILAAILFFVIDLPTIAQHPQGSDMGYDPGLALQPPVFLKSAHAAGLAQVDFGFIVEEAGIAAYTNLNQELDLIYLESYFKTIRQQTDQFIAGIMIVPGYEELPVFAENAEVQVFVHRDGWIVSYLTRWQLGSTLFDWVHYDEKRLTTTLLENVIRVLASDMGVADFTVSYYDFRYPEATSMLLVAERSQDLNESFMINVPRGLTIYESSWSFAKFSSACGGFGCQQGDCKLNADQLSVFKPPEFEWRLSAGDLSKARFSVAKDHILSVSGNGSPTYCGIAIVYREALK